MASAAAQVEEGDKPLPDESGSKTSDRGTADPKAADANVATLLAAAAEVAAAGAGKGSSAGDGVSNSGKGSSAEGYPAGSGKGAVLPTAPAAPPETLPAAAAFRSAADQAAKMLEEEERPPPPEDLALREKLVAFTEAQGKSTARAGYNNVLKILRRLQQDPKNAKLHEMRQDVLERALGKDLFFALEAAGFSAREAQAATAAAFAWQPEGGEGSLASTLHEVQRAADLCLDPDNVSFAEVSEMVAQGRTLPGIADINDKVEEPLQPTSSKIERPRKPWER